jgi:hypothetical protein
LRQRVALVATLARLYVGVVLIDRECECRGHRRRIVGVVYDHMCQQQCDQRIGYGGGVTTGQHAARFGRSWRVYTIWHSDGRFIYVGMSGRGITTETSRRNTPQGIYTRLQSHASGRRSGDQFCVYVADRLVLPALSQDDITAIASGRHQMDAFVRRYIHENLCYRFVMLPDGAAAYAVEAAIKSGEWELGRPILNPGG